MGERGTQIKFRLEKPMMEKFLHIKNKYGLSTNSETARFCVAREYDRIKDQLPPRYLHFNAYEDRVTLKDTLLDKLVNVRVVPHKGKNTFHFYCEEDESKKCDHIRFILNEIPEKTLKPLKIKGYRYQG